MIEPLTHEEYQRSIREILAPTLEYKKKWEELKDWLDCKNIDVVGVDEAWEIYKTVILKMIELEEK